MDQQQQVGASARVVAQYLDATAPAGPLLATLGRATLREDAGFHQFQMAEATLRQYQHGPGSPQGRTALIGAVRFLAAHSPTSRSAGQDVSYRLPVRARRPDIPGRLGAWFQDCLVIPARPGGCFWGTPPVPRHWGSAPLQPWGEAPCAGQSSAPGKAGWDNYLALAGPQRLFRCTTIYATKH